jgi:hypothetical protein
MFNVGSRLPHKVKCPFQTLTHSEWNVRWPIAAPTKVYQLDSAHIRPMDADKQPLEALENGYS